MWFPEFEATQQRWIQTSTSENPLDFWDQVLRSLIGNLLVLPIALVTLLGLVIALQKILSLSRGLEKTRKGLGAIQRQMGLEFDSWS